jgi:hypothetical protein
LETSGGAATGSEILALPAGIGRRIIEAGAVIARPLLGTDNFVKFCRERGVSVDRERLLRLEKLGAFAPVFRVRTPPEEVPPFSIPVRDGNNWFDAGWAWDTTGVPATYAVPDAKDRSQEGYYSVFQLDYLHFVLTQFTLSVHMDGFVEDGEGIDWAKNSGKWVRHARGWVEDLRVHEYRRAVALLCQYVSNRYFPSTQSDKRRIHLRGAGFSSDRWTVVHVLDWDWDREARAWDPQHTAALFDLTTAKLRHAYTGLAMAQAHCDPLERWYQLVQFVAVRERERLKGDALRAEALRSGAHMLRLLYKDLYGEELPHPNEITSTVVTHVPELAIRADPRRYLEFVANRYGLNPQPQLSLIVEGESEAAAVRRLFDVYHGANPGTFGIEIIVLGGLDAATGGKEDRFRAILRLVDYLHHHQTLAFLMLDNENYARQLKKEARKATSIHSSNRYVTRPEYIRIWSRSFEFDNFSCTEIAAALRELAQGQGTFTTSDVTACRAQGNPGSQLKKLYRERTGSDLPKLRLVELLVERACSDQASRPLSNRPLIKTLNRVVRLTVRNPLPVMHEIWEKNQASKYLGKKRRPRKRS